MLLNQALINCALQFGYRRGFKPVHTPFFMQASAVGGVAAQPLRGCDAAGGAPGSGFAMLAAAHAHEELPPTPTAPAAEAHHGGVRTAEPV